jgi:alkylhydroperoxidase family enzyme
MVAAVLEDWRTAPVNEKVQSALGFLEKLTVSPAEVEHKDIEPMRSAGLSDKAIEEAVYVCFLFSVMDRLADALGFDIHSPKDFQRGGRMLYSRGYRRLSLPG